MRYPLLLALVASPLLATALNAEPTAIVINGRNVTLDVPEGWTQSFEQATEKAFIRGYVPPATEGAGTHEMMTLTVTFNLAGLPNLTTVDFVNFGLSAIQAQCKGDFAQDVISPDFTVADRPALGVFMSCANLTGKPDGQSQEVAMIAFRGAKDFYALQWIDYDVAREKAAAYDAATWQTRVETLLGAARLCELIAGEVAPAPCPTAP